jgi:hypothetical protein
MAQVFLSYASEDHDRAKEVATALQACGWSVWWDRQIPFGQTFDQVIGEALERANCVVVLWSASAVRSNWVKDEAADGEGRGILVPAKIDDVPLPLGFRRLQTASLSCWNGSLDHPEFKRLVSSITRLAAPVPDKREPSNESRQQSPASSSQATTPSPPQVPPTRSSPRPEMLRARAASNAEGSSEESPQVPTKLRRRTKTLIAIVISVFLAIPLGALSSVLFGLGGNFGALLILLVGLAIAAAVWRGKVW